MSRHVNPTTPPPCRPVDRSSLSGRHLHDEIVAYYRSLLLRYGAQNWWPAQSRFEVIVGAFLTQNTNWSNVEKALSNLRRARALSVNAVREIPAERLEELVRPSGYFRQKAARLKGFVSFLDLGYAGSLTRMFAQPAAKLRAELLALKGVGPETADSILLYAGNHPVFVVDAYTRRLLERHGLVDARTGYEEVRAMIEAAVAGGLEPLRAAESGKDPRHKASRMSGAVRSELAQHFNELHALIVRAGNEFCRATPACEGCPLKSFLSPAQRATAHKRTESK